VPQIITWISKILTKPKVALYLHPTPEIGYTTFGPIFNVTLALLSEKKDVIVNKFSVKIKHESGATYNFDWDGLSEDINEIQSPIGETTKIKKIYLPLVVKVLHTGVAQVFVRFQHQQFKTHSKKPYADAIDKFNLLKLSGKLNTEEKIDALVSEPEFDKLIKFFSSEFIWAAGKYIVTFEFSSPNKFKYQKSKYTFNLIQSDIDALRKNLGNLKDDIIQNAKVEIIPDYKSNVTPWQWRYPELIEE